LEERARFSLPKARRIRKRSEFLPVQQAGSRITLPCAILLLAARLDDGPARLGITVTRKFGGAVQRNRAKRLIREAFRRSPGLFPPGIDLVVIPKASAANSLSLAGFLEEWQGASRLIAARASSLRRALAKTRGRAHTAAAKGKPE
jgi:ribonuclease P protein component